MYMLMFSKSRKQGSFLFNISTCYILTSLVSGQTKCGTGLKLECFSQVYEDLAKWENWAFIFLNKILAKILKTCSCFVIMGIGYGQKRLYNVNDRCKCNPFEMNPIKI